MDTLQNIKKVPTLFYWNISKWYETVVTGHEIILCSFLPSSLGIVCNANHCNQGKWQLLQAVANLLSWISHLLSRLNFLTIQQSYLCMHLFIKQWEKMKVILNQCEDVSTYFPLLFHGRWYLSEQGLTVKQEYWVSMHHFLSAVNP